MTLETKILNPETQTSIDFKDEQQRIKKLVGNIVEEAKKQGATQCEVAVSLGKGLSVNVRLSELETVEFHKDLSIGITAYRGKKKGTATTSDGSWEAICDTIRAADNIANYSCEDPFSGLAEADLMATSWPDLDLYHPWDIDANAAKDLALRAEDAGRAFDKRITNSEGASVSSFVGVKVLGNSHGFIGSHLSSHQSIQCSLLASQDEEMQTEYWYTAARAAQDLQDPESIGKIAAERAVSRLGSQKIATGKFPILFASNISSSLIGSFLSAISGPSQYQKSSFLLDQIGNSIFPDWVNISEEPHLKKALGSEGFDNDGLATYQKNFITQGYLTQYLLSVYSARKLGLKSTANAGGTNNLILKGNVATQNELIKMMGTGLLVTNLIGDGVNIVTGDYSKAITGFWIENGIIKHPVSEVTIAGNLKDMFQNLTAAGQDYDIRKSSRIGSLLVEGMTIAGN